jgi:FkbM family methyltransferase
LDRCVDVGANVGVHTVRLARLVGADGEVIAIEPDPRLVQRINRNIAINGVASVRLVNAAASERVGEMRLLRPSPHDADRAMASLLHHPHLTGITTTVPVVTVDDVCAGEEVSLIKIDVAGHEAAVVRGAGNTIARCAPSIVFAYAPALVGDAVAQTPFGWLADCGSQMFRVRAARHGLTGRVRLALDRQRETPAAGGNFLAVSPQAAMRLRLLLV